MEARGIGLVPADLSSPITKISDSGSFVHGPRTDRLWVVYGEPNTVLSEGQRVLRRWSVEEITLDGTVVTPRRKLPVGGTPIIGVEGGLLISTFEHPYQSSGLTLWDPKTGRSLWTIPEAGTWVIDATSDEVAFASDCALAGCSRVAFVDVASGRVLRTKALPSGAYANTGAYSADGHTLAVLTYEGEMATVALLEAGSSVANDRALSTGLSSKRVFGSSTLSWSADGKSVLVSILDSGSLGQKIPVSGARPSTLGAETDLLLVSTRR